MVKKDKGMKKSASNAPQSMPKKTPTKMASSETAPEAPMKKPMMAPKENQDLAQLEAEKPKMIDDEVFQRLRNALR